MSVLRAKMVVNCVQNTMDSENKIEQQKIILNAVYGGEGSENHQWSKWTPSGSLELTITNPNAFDKVFRGSEFFVDLVPVVKEEK